MTCHPTVGEVRVVNGHHIRVDAVTQFGLYWHGWLAGCGKITASMEVGRIVIVAPENRARVTAGPDWMRV